jgi:hypothetical protein
VGQHYFSPFAIYLAKYDWGTKADCERTFWVHGEEMNEDCRYDFVG